MRALLLSLAVMSSQALAFDSTYRDFAKMMEVIIEGSNEYNGKVIRGLKENILATSTCFSIDNREDAFSYYFNVIMEFDQEYVYLQNRERAEKFFGSSWEFIFCKKTESYTRLEEIHYYSIVNMDDRASSLTVIYDLSKNKRPLRKKR